MSESINFTPEKVEQFKTELKNAKEKSNGNPDATFFFDWKEFRVDFAEYMVEYLDSKMKEATQ